MNMLYSPALEKDSKKGCDAQSSRIGHGQVAEKFVSFEREYA